MKNKKAYVMMTGEENKDIELKDKTCAINLIQ